MDDMLEILGIVRQSLLIATGFHPGHYRRPHRPSADAARSAADQYFWWGRRWHHPGGDQDDRLR